MIATKLIVCLGFGVDAYHGVCHAHFLENVAALQREGKFGDVHRTDRTRGSKLFINPPIRQYFAFELHAVAKGLMYLDALAQTQTIQEVVALISGFRGGLTPKPWRSIPV